MKNFLILLCLGSKCQLWIIFWNFLHLYRKKRKHILSCIIWIRIFSKFIRLRIKIYSGVCQKVVSHGFENSLLTSCVFMHDIVPRLIMQQSQFCSFVARMNHLLLLLYSTFKLICSHKYILYFILNFVWSHKSIPGNWNLLLLSGKLSW